MDKPPEVKAVYLVLRWGKAAHQARRGLYLIFEGVEVMFAFDLPDGINTDREAYNWMAADPREVLIANSAMPGKAVFSMVTRVDGEWKHDVLDPQTVGLMQAIEGKRFVRAAMNGLAAVASKYLPSWKDVPYEGHYQELQP